MKRVRLFQALGILLVSLLSLAAAQAEPASAPLLPGFQGPQPVPATTCTISTRCYSDQSIISCTGSACFKRVGCSVTCDGVETECPGGDEAYCL